MRALFIVLIVLYVGNQRVFINSSKSGNHVAICVNGNRKRLEIVSKIANLIVPNLLDNVHIDLFLLLTTTHVSTTKINYQTAFYVNSSEEELLIWINTTVHVHLHRERKRRRRERNEVKKVGQFHVEVKFQEDVQTTFTVVNGKVPFVQGYPPANRTAEDLFQSQFRQYNAIRQCVIWMEQREVQLHSHYDYFFRLREDTVFLDKVRLRALIPALERLVVDRHQDLDNPLLEDKPRVKKDVLITTDFAAFDGICDRWYIISRTHVNFFVRGQSEHYFLNFHAVGNAWSNSESILNTLANHLIHQYDETFQHIRVDFCQFPVVTVRNSVQDKNGSLFWNIDYLSIQEFDFYFSSSDWFRGNLSCILENPEWKTMFGTRRVKINNMQLIFP